MYIITQQPALSKLASALIIIAGKHQSPEMCAGWVTFLLTSIPAIPSPQPKPCMLFKFTVSDKIQNVLLRSICTKDKK